MSRRQPTEGHEDVRLVLIDGDNLLHRVRGSRDEAGLRWLLPRLRSWRAPGIEVLVVLDGHPAAGEGVRQRVAPGITFQHAGSATADAVLLATLVARPYADRGVTVVVSDDRAVLERARRDGGLARRVDWLVSRLAAPPGRGSPGRPTVGIGRGPRGQAGSGSADPSGDRDDDQGDRDDRASDRVRWQPGRGATRKRGNPRRGRARAGPGGIGREGP